MSPDPQTQPAGCAVIVFDGVCVLCSGWVQFLLRHDHAGRYCFAAMQSTSGQDLLAAHGLDPADPASFLLIEGGHAFVDTDAIRRVVTGLGGAWRLAHVIACVPRALRDSLYRQVACNRYRWFGRRERCYLPEAAERGRFLS
jgi:predicted DCC family thiol-disulfide oxidoreductase YuxK